MKTVNLLFLFLITTHWMAAQTKLWESAPGARLRNNPVLEEASNASSLSSSNFDNDGFGDVVTSAIYRDSLFFKINTKNFEFEWDAPIETSSNEQVYFMGFSENPILNGQGDPGFNQFLFSVEKNGRIIAILIGFKDSGSNSFTLQEFNIGADYAFLSALDHNQNGITDFLIYNANERRIQLWEY